MPSSKTPPESNCKSPSIEMPESGVINPEINNSSLTIPLPNVPLPVSCDAVSISTFPVTLPLSPMVTKTPCSEAAALCVLAMSIRPPKRDSNFENRFSPVKLPESASLKETNADKSIKLSMPSDKSSIRR